MMYHFLCVCLSLCYNFVWVPNYLYNKFSYKMGSIVFGTLYWSFYTSWLQKSIQFCPFNEIYYINWINCRILFFFLLLFLVLVIVVIIQCLPINFPLNTIFIHWTYKLQMLSHVHLKYHLIESTIRHIYYTHSFTHSHTHTHNWIVRKLFSNWQLINTCNQKQVYQSKSMKCSLHYCLCKCLLLVRLNY